MNVSRTFIPFVFVILGPVSGSIGLAANFEFSLAKESTLVLQQIQSRVRQVLGQDRIPVIVVDLDDTLFMNATRNVFYLKKMIEQDPRFQDLAQVEAASFIGKTWNEWVKTYLSNGNFSEDEVVFRRNSLAAIKEKFRSEGILEDELIEAIAIALRGFDLRTRFIYLTAREQSTKM